MLIIRIDCGLQIGVADGWQMNDLSPCGRAFFDDRQTLLWTVLGVDFYF